MRRRLSNLRRGGSDEGAPGNIQRAIVGGVRREALRQRRIDLGDLRLGTVEHRVVQRTREIERRVPELLETSVAPVQVQGLYPDLCEARLLEQLQHPPGTTQRE